MSIFQALVSGSCVWHVECMFLNSPSIAPLALLIGTCFLLVAPSAPWCLAQENVIKMMHGAIIDAIWVEYNGTPSCLSHCDPVDIHLKSAHARFSYLGEGRKAVFVFTPLVRRPCHILSCNLSKAAQGTCFYYLRSAFMPRDVFEPKLSSSWFSLPVSNTCFLCGASCHTSNSYRTSFWMDIHRCGMSPLMNLRVPL